MHLLDIDLKLNMNDIKDWIDLYEFCSDIKFSYKSVYNHRDDIIPFVGAGLSAFVYPTWLDALRSLSSELSKQKRDEIEDMIISFAKRKTSDEIEASGEKPISIYSISEVIEKELRTANLCERLSEIFDAKKIDYNVLISLGQFPAALRRI